MTVTPYCGYGTSRLDVPAHVPVRETLSSQTRLRPAVLGAVATPTDLAHCVAIRQGHDLAIKK